MHQTSNLEPRFDLIETERAPVCHGEKSVPATSMTAMRAWNDAVMMACRKAGGKPPMPREM
jgi:hypothetical protein